MGLDARIQVRAIQEHTCSISFEALGDLALEQQKKGLPFIIAAVNKRVEDVATSLLSDVNKFDFFDALKLNLHITRQFNSTGKCENPNNRQHIERIIYLWNGIHGKKSEPFQIDPNSFSIMQEINGSIEQDKETFDEITTIATACQHDDRNTQISAQITLALKLWEEEPEESAFWIQRIHNTFSDSFLQDISFDAKPYANQLKGLYKISQSPLIYFCICISELTSNFCIDLALDALLKKDPENILALTLKGVLYAFGSSSVAQDIEKARECLFQVLRKEREAKVVWSTLSSIAVLLTQGGNGVQKDARKAYELLTQVIEISPNAVCAHATLGDLLRAGVDGVPQDIQKACEHLTKAIELDPRSAFAHATLGEILRVGAEGVQRNLKAAYEHLTKAVELNPMDDFAHASLGALLNGGGDGVLQDVQKACEHFTKAVDLNSESAFARFCLGSILMHGGEGVQRDRKKAYELLMEALELVPNDSTMSEDLVCSIHMLLIIALKEGGDGLEQDIEKAKYHEQAYQSFFDNVLDPERQS